MYSGTTLTPFSGSIIGAHQKLDRLARGHLEKILVDNSVFPPARRILHFEGNKGPDAIKRKSPAKDEPWHFYSPFDDDDSGIVELIRSHYNRLVMELKAGNEERVAFEAAWLAHAIADGLTPAHHYPYEQEVGQIWGADKTSRQTVLKKWMPPANSGRQRMSKSWKVWGPKGLISMHVLFEFGVATIMAPLSVNEAIPKSEDIKRAVEVGYVDLFKHSAREIAVLDMYERYKRRGWSTKLIYDVRHRLCPTIVQTITLTWYLALVDANLINPKTLKQTKNRQ